VLISQGVKEGSSLSTLLFCLYIKPALDKIIQDHPHLDLTAYADDLTYFAAADTVMPRQAIVNELAQLGLHVNPLKTVHECPFKPQEQVVTVLGIPITGNPILFDAAFRETNANSNFWRRVSSDSFSAMERYQLVRVCGLAQYGYAMRHCNPFWLQEKLQALDHKIVESVLVQGGLEEASQDARLQQWISLPLRKGGLGLRSLSLQSKVAFIASKTRAFSQLGWELWNDAAWATEPLLRTWEQLRNDVGVTDSLPEVFEGPEFAAFYERKDQSVGQLQHRIQEEVDTKLLQKVSSELSAHQRRILNYTSRNKGASTALTRLRTLDNHQFEVLCRLRFALDVAPGKTVNVCKCKNRLDDSGHHWLGCASLPRAVTRRHNLLVKALDRVLTRQGCYVIMERKQPGQRQGSTKRADLTIHMEGRIFLADVTVVNTLAPSYLSQAPEALLEAAYRRKLSSYEDVLRQVRQRHPRDSVDVAPIVCDVLGVFHPKSFELLQSFASGVTQEVEKELDDDLSSSRDRFQVYLEVLSRALARGNASCVQSGKIHSSVAARCANVVVAAVD
jgi:hypothetical protein